MSIDLNDNDHRRVSTSSQTNYPDMDKILYPRSPIPADVHKNLISPKLSSLKVPFPAVKIRKGYNNSYFPSAATRVDKYIFKPIEKKIHIKTTSWTNEILNNFPVSQYDLPLVHKNKANTKTIEEKYMKSYKREKHVKRDPISDELFYNLNQTNSKKIQKDYVMHKTFYDIIEELNQRKKQ